MGQSRNKGPDGLTDKQRRFVEAYAGSGTEAAKAAGLSPQSVKWFLKQPAVINAIKDREKQRIQPLVMNREQRQQFWSSVVQDPNASMADRLRASELLAKSEGDFLERIETNVQHQMVLPAGLGVDELRALARIPSKALTAGPMVDAELVVHEADVDDSEDSS